MLRVNLMGVEFPPLWISLRRYTWLLQLLTTAKVQIGSVADYTGECDGGEKKTVKSIKTFLLCVTKEAEDNDQAATDDDDANASVKGVVSSQTSLRNSPSSSLSASNSASSSSPAPTTSVASRPSEALAAVAASIVLFVVLFASS